MNTELLKLISQHIQHNDFLRKEDVLHIIKEYPELAYKGKAYRILLFSNKESLKSLEDDLSFSLSLKGIKNYFNQQDIDYYQYSQIYEVQLLGLDLKKIVDKYNLVYKDLVELEEEIILGQLFDQSLLINDSSINVDKFLSNF